VLKIKLKNKMR